MNQVSALPNEWVTRRLKHLLAEPLKYGANEAALSEDRDDPRFVRITDIADDGTLRPDTFRSLSPEVAQPYLLKDGDLLFARSGATVGKSVMYSGSWGPCCFAGYLIRARPDSSKALPEYIRYFSESRLYWQHITSEQIQATIQNVSAERYANLPVPMPDVAGQREIVGFLNRQTSKIDALIDKQEQLVSTLREDRTATITHAVTKGIEPQVPLVDSGVPWLGAIPKHWKVIQSRRLFTQRKTRASPEDEQLTASQKYGVIPQKEFMEREGTQVTQVILNADILKHVEAGDFVISMRSFQGGIEYSPYAGAVSSAYVPLVPKSGVDAEFFKYALKSVTYIQALQSTSNLVRDGQALRFENFSLVPLPVLSISEQRKIATFLRNRCHKIDVLVAKAKQTIETLREYRSALITDAVTGKIDVRGAV